MSLKQAIEATERQKVLAFHMLNAAKEDIDFFTDKVSVGGFLRSAVISHLKVSFNFSVLQATDVLNNWIEFDRTK